jgi:glycerophosphoryl diester phosphodiesterase
VSPYGARGYASRGPLRRRAEGLASVAMRPGSLAVSAQDRPGAAPLVVAHRGAWNPAPQNSLEAFEDAITMGCDAIELDVRRTADDRLVVVHDARSTGRAVAKLTHEQLIERPRTSHAPLLEAVLELTAGRIGLDIELKEDGYVPQVMAVVARHLSPDAYVVTSFRDAVLPAVKRAVPEARTGLLLAPRAPTARLAERIADARVDFLAPHAATARAGLLAWAAARDLGCWLWTVNERRALRTLSADRRVYALITDRPDRALEARAAAAAPRAEAA